MNLEQQIASLRARMLAKSAPERARRVLMASGVPWRLAGAYVLDQRRRAATNRRTAP